MDSTCNHSKYMKIRLKDNSIRIRFSIDEVRQLCKEHGVISQTSFPGSFALKYQILLRDNPIPDVSFRDHSIQVILPIIELDNWDTNEKVGFEWNIPVSQNDALFLLVEKDFKCLTERPHEDESNLFPNPKDSH